MNEVLEPPRWEAVGLVIDQNLRHFLDGRYGLVQDIVSWLKSVELFRAAVDERMILREATPEDLRQHKTWIATLIAEGERLVTEAQGRGGLPSGAVRFTLADVEATVENLRSDERMWHSTMTPDQKDELLKAVFHVEEPGT